MKTSFLFFAACFLSFSLQAQKCSQVDFDAIYAQTQNTKSKFYLPKLLKRFRDLDTTLTTDEYKHLYYGYTRSEFYSPLSIETTQLSHHLGKGLIDSVRKSIEIIDKSNPVNLNLIHGKIVIASTNQEQGKVKSLSTQLAGLLKAILSSGNGQTPETAFVITAIEDEYFILNNILRLKYQRRGASDCCDVYAITSQDGSSRDLYFNKEKSSEYIRKMLQEKGLDTEKKKK